MRITTILAFLIMFFSIFGLFFIIDSLNKIAEQCQKGTISKNVCEKFTGFSLNMLLVLLIIGGFILILSITIFIIIR